MMLIETQKFDEASTKSYESDAFNSTKAAAWNDSFGAQEPLHPLGGIGKL